MNTFLNTRQAAKQLNISYSALLYRVKKGLLPIAAIVGRGYLFSKKAVDNYNPQGKSRKGRPSRPLRFTLEMMTVKELSKLSGRSADQVRYDMKVGRLTISGRLDHAIYFLPDVVEAYCNVSRRNGYRK